jgi:hypothetical protein
LIVDASFYNLLNIFDLTMIQLTRKNEHE